MEGPCGKREAKRRIETGNCPQEHVLIKVKGETFQWDQYNCGIGRRYLTILRNSFTSSLKIKLISKVGLY